MMSELMREQAGAILKAAAHPTRLFLLEKLLEGELCVCELSPKGVDVATVSKHLSQLKAAGLVKSRKRGLKVFYSIAIPEAALIIKFSIIAVKSRSRVFLKAAGE
ncbi:MAG: metalloregulator ArsR/SmtB family transcription factor [Nitrospinota bacterium]|nr:metalloregulator ArsR/SmtB family transcription factor [Nitrospinota bacterium]